MEYKLKKESVFYYLVTGFVSWMILFAAFPKYFPCDVV